MPTYIWVTDDSTGHQYDVDEQTLRPGMTPVKGYPTNSGPGARPRPPKHRVAKDGKPAKARDRTPTNQSADAAAAATTQEEGQPA